MALSLWTRRTSLRCRFQGAPTLVVIFASGAALLMSTGGSAALSGPLHSLTGLWNVEDFIGHLMAVACASALAYVVMGHFSDDDATLSEDFHRIVGLPLTLVVPFMFALFVKSVGSKEYNPDFHHIGGALGTYFHLDLYWVLFAGVMIYLMVWIARHLLALRHESPCVVVTYLYLATTILTMVVYTAVAVHAITPLDLPEPAWGLGYICAMGWTGTPALSWYQRQRHLAGKFAETPSRQW